MKTIEINTLSAYTIDIEEGILSQVGQKLRPLLPASKVALITDENVSSIYLSTLTDSLEEAGYIVHSLILPPGEESKSLKELERVLNFLVENKLTKSDFLLSLGGGVMGDLTGFAAATYLRGIPFVQVPTTLLAAVDASIGGKTAINLSGGKNLMGAFWQPAKVIIDPNTFATLSRDQRLNGMAEVIKSAIVGCPNLFDDIEKNPLQWEDHIPTKWIIQSILVKKRLIEADERDQGQRQLLNLGHTIGHGIEHKSGYTLSHGVAVAMGMAFLGRLSFAQSKCQKRIKKLLAEVGFPLTIEYSGKEFLSAIRSDKKIRGNQLSLVIPKEIGHCQLKTIDLSSLEQELKELLP